ncbi:hypothetical protein V9T40_006485 [Parthenolecanium corni]|uniref:EGF-like domain-containing protein n=1 Tax=Parthenolecanium corni TaxID=536013 RepID=A0AAN9Y6P4_9HEMI
MSQYFTRFKVANIARYPTPSINSSNELSAKNPSVVDDRIDIIYQKDASFSASLDVPKDAKEVRNVNNVTKSVTFVTRNKFSQHTNVSHQSTSTEATHVNDSTLCAKSCGTGICLMEIAEQDSDSDSSQRCQCTLGKTGSNCQAVYHCLAKMMNVTSDENGQFTKMFESKI